MILVIVGVLIALTVGVLVAMLFGSMSGSRALGVLIALTLLPTLVFVPVAVRVVTDVPTANRPATFSHDQLEADRLMTVRMTSGWGQDMDLQMTTDGMLERSRTPAYVAALERHVFEFNRMAGLPT